MHYIESIRDWLKNLAEDRSNPMDVRVHRLLWDKAELIDHDIYIQLREP